MNSHRNGVNFNTTNELAAITVLQAHMPNSRSVSGKVSTATTNANIDMANDCTNTVTERLAMGIQLTDSTSQFQDFNITYDPKTVRPSVDPIVEMIYKGYIRGKKEKKKETILTRSKFKSH